MISFPVVVIIIVIVVVIIVVVDILENGRMKIVVIPESISPQRNQTLSEPRASPITK